MALAWAGALAPCDWREVFPALAGYPGELFDYDAGDLHLGAAQKMEIVVGFFALAGADVGR